jgi:adenylate kinase family enzyme
MVTDAPLCERQALRRIAVIGSSGSGKSTLAARLAAHYGLPYVATDAVYWQPGWRPTPATEVRAWLARATAAEHWVTDGNFEPDRDVLWARAELIVWLDLPRRMTVWRALSRNLGCWLSREPVWGQRMTLAKAVAGVRHAARSHGQKHRDYPVLLAAVPGVQVVRIASARELERWLSALGG